MIYLLEVEDLKVKVGNGLILDGVSFGIRRGEIHVLFGLNGSGKTTLIGAIVGFQNPPEITGVKLEDLLKLCLGKSP
jgi:Fe-S cluster assembly ATP-binding protein